MLSPVELQSHTGDPPARREATLARSIGDTEQAPSITLPPSAGDRVQVRSDWSRDEVAGSGQRSITQVTPPGEVWCLRTADHASVQLRRRRSVQGPSRLGAHLGGASADRGESGEFGDHAGASSVRREIRRLGEMKWE